MSVPRAVAKAIVAALGREREAAADRVAAETLGSPESLVAALRSLDDRIANAAAEDLRAVSDVSSLSTLPFDPSIVDESGAKHSGLPRNIFDTHLTAQGQIERLRELERNSSRLR